MRKFTSVFWITLILGVTLAQAGGKIQNEDVKSVAELVGAGSDMSHLINDTKIYVSANSINQTLSTAISSGLIGGSGSGGAGLNLLKNPGAEVGLNNITDTIPADLTRTTVAANVLFGQGSFSLLASAAETVTWDAVTIPTGLYGANCAAAVVYKGNGVGYTLQVADGSSNILTSAALVNSSSGPTTQPLYFVCPSSGTMKLQIVTTGSAGQLYFDNALLGTNPNTQFSQAQFLGGAVTPTTASCVWSSGSSTSTFTNFTAQAACPVATVTGNASAPATKIPAITFNTLPPGQYLVTVQGAFSASGGAECRFSLSDGTSNSGLNDIQNSSGNDFRNTLISRFSYTTAQTNITFQVQYEDTVGSSCALSANTLSRSLDIAVYAIPGPPQVAFNPSQVANSWSGFHGSNCAWTGSGSPSFSDFPTPSVCTFTQRTNRNFGTVSSLNNGTPGHNFPGIVFTPSRVGTYFVCALSNATSSTNATPGFSLTDGTTEVGEGALSFDTSLPGNPLPVPICSTYLASSTSPVTLKIQHKESSGNTSIFSSSGTSAIEWSIFQIDQPFPAPLLVNSVVTSSNGVEHLTRVKVLTSCTSDPCTIASSTPDVTAVNRSATGTYTVHFSAGAFSAPPTCMCNVESGSGVVCNGNTPAETTTAAQLQTFVTTTGSLSDTEFSMLCMGPH